MPDTGSPTDDRRPFRKKLVFAWGVQYACPAQLWPALPVSLGYVLLWYYGMAGSSDTTQLDRPSKQLLPVLAEAANNGCNVGQQSSR